MLILAVESSCDETAVALVRDGRNIFILQTSARSCILPRYSV